MKTVKRILAVFFLIIVIITVGYFVFTSSRFSFNESDFREYIGRKYVSENNEYTVIFKAKDSLVYRTGSGRIPMKIENIENKTVSCIYGEERMFFVIIDENTIYDLQSDKLLERDIAYEQ